MERYEDWKELEPLTDIPDLDIKGVALVDFDEYGIKAGDVGWLQKGRQNMFDDVLMFEIPYKCGIIVEPCDVAKLPEQKQERKIVHTSCAWVFTEAFNNMTNFIGAIETIATCNDGTAWHHSGASDAWTRLPPIPQD